MSHSEQISGTSDQKPDRAVSRWNPKDGLWTDDEPTWPDGPPVDDFDDDEDEIAADSLCDDEHDEMDRSHLEIAYFRPQWYEMLARL